MDTSTSDLMLEKARAARSASGLPTLPTPLELIDQLGRNLDRLEVQLDQLAVQLEPVLVEAVPSPALATVEDVTPRTRLSQQLAHLAAWAERLGERANDLHARVEL